MLSHEDFDRSKCISSLDIGPWAPTMTLISLNVLLTSTAYKINSEHTTYEFPYYKIIFVVFINICSFDLCFEQFIPLFEYHAYETKKFKLFNIYNITFSVGLDLVGYMKTSLEWSYKKNQCKSEKK